jgi:hypothetical protein
MVGVLAKISIAMKSSSPAGRKLNEWMIFMLDMVEKLLSYKKHVWIRVISLNNPQ